MLVRYFTCGSSDTYLSWGSLDVSRYTFPEDIECIHPSECVWMVPGTYDQEGMSLV